LGINIGGAKTVFGFVESPGKCLAEFSIPTRAQEDANSLVARPTVKIREMFAPISDQGAIPDSAALSWTELLKIR
jgi:hypothetical protein